MSSSATRVSVKPIGMSAQWPRQQPPAVRVFDSSKQPSKPAASRRPVQRRTALARRPRTIQLPPDIDRELATHCAAHGREISDIVAHALVLYLERQR